MSKYSSYRKRVQISGKTHPDGIKNSTKRQARNYILNSPTRSIVELLQFEEQADKSLKPVSVESKTSIVSDKDTFYKRIMLFLPDEGVPLGSYLQYDNKVYLATRVSDVDGYPQAFVEYCNHMLPVKGEESRVLAGYDSLGRPQYKTIQAEYNIPCVATSKIYSVLDNSQVPLPEGAIMIYIPYHEKVNIPVNFEFQIHGDIYQVTTVNKINVLTDEDGKKYGYLEIRGQSDVKKYESR